MNLSEQTQQDIQQTLHCWVSSHRLSARSRLLLLRQHEGQYDWLDDEFANFEENLSWLATQKSSKEAHCFIEYLQLLAPYMQQRYLQAEILHWCNIGVQAAEILRENPAWLLFLSGQTQYALGQWDEARMSFQAAIKAGEKEDVPTYARALLALGSLEFNQGNYRMAFEILKAAQATSQETDQQQMQTLLGETAAYYLNRKEFDKALSLYQEVDRLQKQGGATESSDHALLMFGVVYRRKKKPEQAKIYLQELLERGEAQQNRAATATAAHHLAWTFLNQKDTTQARKLCGRALTLYEEIGDERGLASAYEQLGCIALAEKQEKEAVRHFQRALLLTHQLHNQQGEASILRHLGIAYLTMRQMKTGFRILWQSLVLYQQLGVLTRQRVSSIFRECLMWVVGWRQWAK
jgi:tetratricopeptide (TPR) repeat protein